MRVMKVALLDLSKGERLKEFLRRLSVAEACADHDSAFALVERTLTSVENELTIIPNNPEAWKNDGRMYPPQPDAERPSPFPGVRCFRSRKHYTDIGRNGAIRISAFEGQPILIDKAGIDGKTVDQL
ncbi:MAG: hypothetical protein ACREXM_16615 [Gammaproteobacteria bacterium]